MAFSDFSKNKDKINKFLQEFYSNPNYNYTGNTYIPTPVELSFAAKIAWKNAAKCIGRSYYTSLLCRDLRNIENAQEVFKELQNHLEIAFNNGKIKSVISIFDSRFIILNSQLMRYAGYENMGDPLNKEITQKAINLGFHKEKRTNFDILPLIIHDKVLNKDFIFNWEEKDIKEVQIFHPEYGDLNLKWYALPIISNMRLCFAGLNYECIPFNGWYMETEIAARNLADKDRYNFLPKMAEIMNLDTKNKRSLWQDRALVELNRAILYSFDKAGIKIDDHHSVSEKFIYWEDKEKSHGKTINGRWDWLIPPLSPATTEIWSRSYQEDKNLTPGFFYRKKIKKCPIH